ncbi:endothelial differentiation-related factor 1 [Geospiza fortis]|uniref:Endothelial differentiation-related factor 1 n=1 Tax=Geospiza fortis TaxID=48883 RepID=A0A8N5HTB7_GEOFO|nr:endothelial differentiation-related factor 1 [Geospiza fortis]
MGLLPVLLLRRPGSTARPEEKVLHSADVPPPELLSPVLWEPGPALFCLSLIVFLFLLWTTGAAGQNKQHFITKNTAKLDRETEELHHDRVSLEVGKVIQQGRQSKGLTQKDLATKINEKPQVIADYESGRAIPNNQVMGKIERAIGLKLRGKDIGKPLETGPKGK